MTTSASGLDEQVSDGFRNGLLLLQHCLACGNVQFYPRAYCGSCRGTALELRPGRGTGTVYSFTMIRRAPSAEWAERVPYPLALVELSEGPRLMSTIVGLDERELEIGLAVELAFDELVGETPLPVFTRASG